MTTRSEAVGDYQNIPKSIRAVERWMGTIFETRPDGKLNKPPYSVTGDKPYKADKTNPDNWASFDMAVLAWERGAVDAIGFVFTEDDPFYVVDFDSVLEPETGQVNKEALGVMQYLASYTELSCSSTGVHVLAEGVKPDYAKCKDKSLGFELEIYDRARFLVFTGKKIGRRDAIEDRQAELDDLCWQFWKPQAPATPAVPERVHNIDDVELLKRIHRSESGKRFAKLYEFGNWEEDFKSHSEADFSLINALIFWTAADSQRIISLFKSSALYRPGKGNNYVERSVSSALESYSGDFYGTKKVKAVRQASGDNPLPAVDPLDPYIELLLDPSCWTGRKGASAYKTFAGLVFLAADYGIVDDDGNLAVGTDVRRLAEVAGTSHTTVCQSGLPHLLLEMKLIRWQKGNGTNAGTFVLVKLSATTLTTKRNHPISTGTDNISDSSSDQSYAEILRLIIRMRSGQSKGATLLRLGMPAMFTVIALVANGPRKILTIDKLAEDTGRQKSALKKSGDKPGAIPKLKAAGIIQEVSEEAYRLTDEFADRYEQSLELSGITQSERIQRFRHEEDRKRRLAGIPVEKRIRGLRGKKKMRPVIRQANERAYADRIEEQRKKVGKTVEVWLSDMFEGVSGYGFEELRLAWLKEGGEVSDVWRAVRRPEAPYHLKKEADGRLYVYKKDI